MYARQNIRIPLRSEAALAFSHDGSVLATEDKYFSVELRACDTGGLLATLRGHMDRVLTCAISRCGMQVATGSRDRGVRLWDPVTEQTIRVTHTCQMPAKHVAFSSCGSRLLFISAHGDAHVWCLQTYNIIQSMQVPGGGFDGCTFLSDGSAAFCGSMAVWVIGMDGAQRSIPIPRQARYCAVAEDGRVTVSNAWGGSMAICVDAEPRLVVEAAALRHVTCSTVSASGDLAVSCSHIGDHLSRTATIQMWAPRSGLLLGTAKLDCGYVVGRCMVAPACNMVAITGSITKDGICMHSVLLWDIWSRQAVLLLLALQARRRSGVMLGPEVLRQAFL